MVQFESKIMDRLMLEIIQKLLINQQLKKPAKINQVSQKSKYRRKIKYKKELQLKRT
jgi:hypothetical protein